MPHGLESRVFLPICPEAAAMDFEKYGVLVEQKVIFPQIFFSLKKNFFWIFILTICTLILTTLSSIRQP